TPMSTPPKQEAALRRTGFDPAYFEEFENKLFYEGPGVGRRLSNFAALLGLATVIATFALLSASTASVIGAMIVAPLMGPIMATAAAVVMGNARRAGLSLALVAAGVVGVILLSLVLTWIVPDVNISFTENGELASRISPGLLALLTALASGAAGAFITARREISDSIGGVAIAISLVPPLCVVGIALNQGEWTAALGAFTLFMTNFLAILLAGGITFLIEGLGAYGQQGENVRTRRTGFALIAIATVLIAIPLGITSYQVIERNTEIANSGAVIEEWLAGTEYSPVMVSIDGEDVDVAITGSGDLRSLADLANQVAARLGRPIVIELRTIPSQLQPSGAVDSE
ncbi:MAG: DUF389 domain-containing protein, partial [Caldilineaceae bacterium]